MACIGVRTENNLLMLSYRHSREGEAWQDVEEQVEITWTRCPFGGQRPWFFCPGVVNGIPCRRRVAVLYSAGPYYLCRHCYHLSYACQSEGPADRAVRRAGNIRLRLGGSASLLELFPPKPKHMRWATYERLRSEAELAERRWWVSLDAWLGKLRR